PGAICSLPLYELFRQCSGPILLSTWSIDFPQVQRQECMCHRPCVIVVGSIPEYSTVGRKAARMNRRGEVFLQPAASGKHSWVIERQSTPDQRSQTISRHRSIGLKSSFARFVLAGESCLVLRRIAWDEEESTIIKLRIGGPGLICEVLA